MKAQGHKQCRRTAKNEHSDNLQHGEDAPVLNLKMSEHMFKISDRERQAWLLKETEGVSEKKRKVASGVCSSSLRHGGISKRISNASCAEQPQGKSESELHRRTINQSIGPAIFSGSETH